MESSIVSSERRRPPIVESVWARAALVVAAIEAVLVVVGVVPRWTAVVIAAAVLAGYFLRGRRVESPATRQALWALAVSQALVLLVPLALWIAAAVAVVALAALAAIVLVVLVLDR